MYREVRSKTSGHQEVPCYNFTLAEAQSILSGTKARFIECSPPFENVLVLIRQSDAFNWKEITDALQCRIINISPSKPAK